MPRVLAIATMFVGDIDVAAGFEKCVIECFAVAVVTAVYGIVAVGYIGFVFVAFADWFDAGIVAVVAAFVADVVLYVADDVFADRLL